MENFKLPFIERNLLPTIRECLSEHAVDLSVGEKRFPMYLIEAEVSSPLDKDFFDTYAIGDEFKKKIARNVLRGRGQTYGVLVDSDLKYRFAFNRRFADFNFDDGKVVFKPAEEFLIESLDVTDLSQISNDSSNIFNCDSLSDLDAMTMRYALVGGRNDVPTKPLIPEHTGIDGGFSLLDRIRDSYKQKEVMITIGETTMPFYLVNTSYQTSLLNDFLITYGDELDGFERRIAQNSFGFEPKDNEYGILFSQDLRMQFAFNNKFGFYNNRDKTIGFLPPKDILVRATASAPTKPTKPAEPSQGSGKMVFRYALQGKKE
ncbi:hypothetical protein J4474_00640 [Candidatus Pacearchaeota archaeon]|nr:hypothetical protein [Candidatus Pacearchaeota archaeon]